MGRKIHSVQSAKWESICFVKICCFLLTALAHEKFLEEVLWLEVAFLDIVISYLP